MVQREKGVLAHPRKRAVIFDFDGTIADSLPAVIATFEDMTRRPKRFTPKQVEVLRALTLPELLIELKIPKWKVPFLLLRGRRLVRKHMHGINVHKGMAEVIHILHECKVPMYVLSSNSTDNIKKYLTWHKLDHYFAGIYGGASLWGKAPRLLKLIDREKIDIATSWYVGDETRDVSAARATGLKIASVTWGYNNQEALTFKDPDVIIDEAWALLPALGIKWKK